MTDREKLIELITKGEKLVPCSSMTIDCIDRKCWECQREASANYLIANGVTVQKWIPVTERLPKLIPCDAGTAYSEAVNVLTSGRKVFTAIWDGIDFICDARFWEAEGEKITHWTPVLLPLPEPPKEDE